MDFFIYPRFQLLFVLLQVWIDVILINRAPHF